MSCVWISSDWHLGHKNQCRWRTEFRDYREVAYLLFTQYRSVVKKRDLVWFLGDMILSTEFVEMFKSLPGEKRLVLGNHCTERVPFEVITDCFDKVYGLVNYKQSWLSHAPMHPDELRGKINIHGHTHYHNINDPRYVNVCPEQTNWTPVKYQEIIRKYN